MALTVQTSLKAESSFAAGQVSEELLHNTSVDADPVLQATVGYSLPGEKFPNDPISSATMNLILTVVQAGILPVLTLGGVVMNVINMAVFVRQGLSDRINLLLFSLALSDTGYITNSMAYRLPSLFSLVDPTLAQFWMWKINRYVFIGIYMGFLSVSSCQTLLISLERCICVLWPLKAKTLLSVRRMAVVIVFIFVFCLGCCVLVIFKFKTVSLWDPTTNSTVYRTQPARFYLENRLLVGIVFDVIITLSIPTVCVGGVMLATTFISLRMRAVLSWRMQTAHVGTDKTETSSERRERLVTRMLMVVCIMFTACTLPSVFHGFFRFYMEEFELGRRYNNTFLVTICLVHGLASVNSSSNFLIYWTMSTKFRDTLRCLLVLLLHRRPARIE